MNEDCLRAHEIISLAYDGEQVSAEDLASAKTHCASCPECATFVGGLARLRKIGAPSAPARAVDTTLAAVRGVAAQMAEERAAALPDATPAGEASSPSAPTGADVVSVPHRLRWSTQTAWVAAAAAGIVLIVGLITVQGVRYMLAPSGQQVTYVSTDPAAKGAEGLTSGSADSAAQNYSPPASPTGEAASSGTLLRQDDQGAAPPYVVVAGRAFSVSDGEQTIPGDAQVAGSVVTDLGSHAPTAHEVYAAPTTGELYLAVENGRGYPLTAVNRELDGVTYALNSSEVSVFGSWPALPAGMTAPSSDDGSPVFEYAGRDDLGVKIYVLPGTSPTSGFAVAPGTKSSDPAAGNPNWTWWVPVH